jgi:uncharacterized protein YkwD
MRSLTKLCLLTAFALGFLLTPDAEAGLFRNRFKSKTVVKQTFSSTCAPGTTCYKASPQVPLKAMPQVPAKVAPSPQAQAQPTSDPLYAVNAARSQYGLHPLAYDANLAAHADRNNALQPPRSSLPPNVPPQHLHNPNAWQVASTTSDPGGAVSSWLASPSHRPILLSASLRYAGISHSYGYATMNAK